MGKGLNGVRRVDLNKAMTYAMLRSDYSMVSAAFKAGAGLTRKNESISSWLIFNIQKLIRLKQEGDCSKEVKKIVLFILEFDQKRVRVKGLGGNTPLHHAVLSEEPWLVKHLIHCGAEVDEKNHGKDTPLMTLISYLKSDQRESSETLEIISTLLNEKASLHDKNVKGISFLSLIEDLRLHKIQALVQSLTEQEILMQEVKLGENPQKPLRVPKTL